MIGRPSTTGAHEIGHTLGMKHSKSGIMSESQDINRSEVVTQKNITEMLESERGKPGFMKFLINWIYSLYEDEDKQ